jgi:hypothetical protein
MTIKRAVDLGLDRPSLLDSLEVWSFFHRRLTAYARVLEEEARIASFNHQADDPKQLAARPKELG